MSVIQLDNGGVLKTVRRGEELKRGQAIWKINRFGKRPQDVSFRKGVIKEVTRLAASVEFDDSGERKTFMFRELVTELPQWGDGPEPVVQAPKPQVVRRARPLAEPLAAASEVKPKTILPPAATKVDTFEEWLASGRKHQQKLIEQATATENTLADKIVAFDQQMAEEQAKLEERRLAFDQEVEREKARIEKLRAKIALLDGIEGDG